MVLSGDQEASGVFDILGSSRDSRDFWDACGDRQAASIATQGLSLQFSSPPVLSSAPSCTASSDPIKRAAIRELISDMEDVGVVSSVSLSSVGFWSHIFVVPKKQGKWRLVLDLSRLNRLVVRETFQMISLLDVFSSIRPSDWMATLDIESAYWHVPVQPQFRKFFQFRFRERGFQFRVMPFGLTTAPWLFNRIMTPIVTGLGRSGIRVMAYLDDFLVLASRAQISDHLSRVESTLVRAGFSISGKSQRTPSRSLQFLGVVISVDSMSTSIPLSAQESMVSRSRDLLDSPSVSRRDLESLVGSLGFYSIYIFFLRPLFWELTARMNQESLSDERDLQISLSVPLRRCLGRIAASDLSFPRLFSRPSTLFKIMTDASDVGWGATWDEHSIQGRWSARQSRESINAKELRAVVLAISHWGHLLSGRSVLVYTDNVTAAAVVRRRGSPSSPLLSHIAMKLEVVCHRFGIQVLAAHVAGQRNVVADSLSRRRPQPSEWSLSVGKFESLCRRWGRPEVDLFATRDNAKTSVFVSPLPTDKYSDCLTLSWALWRRLYAYPPSRLLRFFVPRLEQLNAHQTLILVFPWWERRPWFQHLRGLWLAEGLVPVPLSLERQDLTQVVQGRRIAHPNPGILNLHAVLLSGRH